MLILFGIVIGAVALTVVMFVVLMQIRVTQMKQANQLLDEYQEENILAYTTSANYLGIESAGMGQVHGNGFLMLTSSFLLLERMAPKQRLQIPLRKIFRVDQVSSFLGRRNMKPILRISFTNEEGEQDTLGIILKDPDKWQELVHVASEQARKFV